MKTEKNIKTMSGTSSLLLLFLVGISAGQESSKEPSPNGFEETTIALASPELEILHSLIVEPAVAKNAGLAELSVIGRKILGEDRKDSLNYIVTLSSIGDWSYRTKDEPSKQLTRKTGSRSDIDVIRNVLNSEPYRKILMVQNAFDPDSSYYYSESGSSAPVLAALTENTELPKGLTASLDEIGVSYTLGQSTPQIWNGSLAYTQLGVDKNGTPMRFTYNTEGALKSYSTPLNLNEIPESTFSKIAISKRFFQPSSAYQVSSDGAVATFFYGTDEKGSWYKVALSDEDSVVVDELDAYAEKVPLGWNPWLGIQAEF